MTWMLRPDQQAYTYDAGYFYPGPAVKDRAGLRWRGRRVARRSQNMAGRNTTNGLPSAPLETPLTPGPLVAAFARWDQQIGASKTK